MNVTAIFKNKEIVNISRRGGLPSTKYYPPSFNEIVESFQAHDKHRILYKIHLDFFDVANNHRLDDQLVLFACNKKYSFLTESSCCLYKAYKSASGFQFAYESIRNNLLYYPSIQSMVRSNYGYYPFTEVIVPIISEHIGEKIIL